MTRERRVDSQRVQGFAVTAAAAVADILASDFNDPIESNTPQISVVIPCRDGAATIGMQLEALASQVGAPEFEIIVVDNRSADGLTQAVARWRNTQHAPTIRIVGAHEHAGASYARNVGAANAQASRLVFCDADDVVSRWFLAHAQLAFSRADLWTGCAIPVPITDFERGVTAVRSTFGDSPTWEGFADNQPSLFPILMGGNFGVTVSIFREIGGFDQSFPTAGDDNDFGFRARQKGFHIPVALSVRTGYRPTPSAAVNARKQRHSAQAHVMLAVRYRAWNQSQFRRWLRLDFRAVAAVVKTAFGKRPRDWASIRGRISIAVGISWGVILYRLLRRLPPTEIGAGL